LLVVEAGAADDLVELMLAREGEERVVELARPVIAAEEKAERNFVRRRETRAFVIAAVDAHAAIDLEAGVVLGPDPFHRRRPFPRVAVLRRVVIIVRGVRVPEAVDVVEPA